MDFQLFLSLEGLEWNKYGPISQKQYRSDPNVKCYVFENGLDDADLFFPDIEEMNERCKTLLDYGDVEYFDDKKCYTLKNWITERLNRPTEPRYRALLGVLNAFCEEAINLKTGVYIDL